MADASGGLTKWAREYETIYILRPDVAAEDADKAAARIADAAERLEAKITKVDNWGKRKLAYVIAKHTRGIFVYVRYVGYNDVVAEIERNLRLLDFVLRFQTIVIRDMIDMNDVVVDPEETKFVAIEQSEDEPEPDTAERLGMVQRERRRDDDAQNDDGLGNEDDDAADDADSE